MGIPRISEITRISGSQGFKKYQDIRETKYIWAAKDNRETNNIWDSIEMRDIRDTNDIRNTKDVWDLRDRKDLRISILSRTPAMTRF